MESMNPLVGTIEQGPMKGGPVGRRCREALPSTRASYTEAAETHASDLGWKGDKGRQKTDRREGVLLRYVP